MGVIDDIEDLKQVKDSCANKIQREFDATLERLFSYAIAICLKSRLKLFLTDITFGPIGRYERFLPLANVS